MDQPTATELIEILGGTNAVARLFSVRPPSVTGWRRDGIPADKRIRMAPLIEKVTGGRIDRVTMFPDDWHRIWPELAAAHPERVPAEPTGPAAAAEPAKAA